MSNVAGSWACTVNSPMGAQEFTLTVVPDGDTFSGEASGEIGRRAIEDGTVEGDTLMWSMAVSKPMPITLTCKAEIDGDMLSGKVKAGIFGSFELTGVRA